jgi:hypothetical protein
MRIAMVRLVHDLALRVRVVERVRAVQRCPKNISVGLCQGRSPHNDLATRLSQFRQIRIIKRGDLAATICAPYISVILATRKQRK